MISVEEFLRRHPVQVESAPDSGPSADLGVSAVFGASADPDQRDGSRRDRSSRRRSVSRTPKRGGFGAGRGTYGEGPENPADADACREAALTLLDSAARSSGALVQRLKAKGYDESVAEETVDRLIEVGLVDDEAYARSMVRYCVGRQLGERGTIRELTRKGVDASLAARAAEHARQAGLFTEAAYELGRRVAARTEGLDPSVRRRRLWSAGVRKGHGPDTIRQVAEDLLPLHDEA
ncbi:RecX family transcriptional regulator [Bifidobacterium simiarum]|uniref:Regulatory protein RecX n=1 Tax=Bifidobacterium simiarum TaxID=2045441 RepID=A0A2M9HEK7_9BIFI|nr:RecX family transcriptional regulator [Bifidobacterium simiarum]